jgi:hypothetical protein
VIGVVGKTPVSICGCVWPTAGGLVQSPAVTLVLRPLESWTDWMYPCPPLIPAEDLGDAGGELQGVAEIGVVLRREVAQDVEPAGVAAVVAIGGADGAELVGGGVPGEVEDHGVAARADHLDPLDVVGTGVDQHVLADARVEAVGIGHAALGDVRRGPGGGPEGADVGRR